MPIYHLPILHAISSFHHVPSLIMHHVHCAAVTNSLFHFAAVVSITGRLVEKTDEQTQLKTKVACPLSSFPSSSSRTFSAASGNLYEYY